MQRLKYFDLPFLMLVTVVAIVLTLVGLSNTVATVQLVLGLPLALVLPGYALTAALFPPSSLGWAERLTMTLGLSICLMALGGLLLNLTPWGLQPSTWVVWLGGLTLVGGAVGAIRARRQRQLVLPAPPTLSAGGNGAATLSGPTTGGQSYAFNLRQLALLGAAIVVLAGAFLVARTGAEQTTATFTQMWMLPSGPNAARIGLDNEERQAVQYRVVLQQGGKTLQEWPAVKLEAGQKWEITTGLPSSTSGPAQALLYRSDAPDQVYRQVTLAP